MHAVHLVCRSSLQAYTGLILDPKNVPVLVAGIACADFQMGSRVPMCMTA